MKFLKPMFMFLRRAVLQGNNVLVHCLAGAHRAGTTGILTLMYFMKLNAEEAQKLATSIRPIINPISDFPDLLKLYEKCQKYKLIEMKQVQRRTKCGYGLSSLKDLSGSQLHLSGGDPRPKLINLWVWPTSRRSSHSQSNGSHAFQESHSAIEESLNLGKMQQKKAIRLEPRKKSDSKEKVLRQWDDRNYCWYWCQRWEFVVKISTKKCKGKCRFAPIVKEEKVKVKKSRRSYDQNHHFWVVR